MVENSTVPGLAHLKVREDYKKTSAGFLEARRKVDGAEGLWRINNSLYDLQAFVKSHPGGAEWINLTRGTDITELFESHHVTDNAEQLLPKFYVREAATSRSMPLTFLPDGFYRTLKKRAVEALKNVDFHRSSSTSNLIADSLTAMTIMLALTGAFIHSYGLVFLAGISLTWTVIAAHNFFHMRSNFRMYYFDLCLMSSKGWRITHVMSHHMYPNTLWDYEMYAVEPFLHWIPHKNKSYIVGLIRIAITPIIWTLMYFLQGIQRYYSVFMEYGVFEIRDIMPFLLPLTMCLFAPEILIALKLWLAMILISSFLFGLISFNSAHHHPDIFHDGDIYRDDMDWGLLEVDAVRDRKVIDDSTFLTLTNFGYHTLHHLLPSVDHHYLPLCMPAFLQTCKEFKLSNDSFTQWELIKGQFQQLMRVTPKKNHR
ncbi:PREDICTED: cytochrome b5-related protein-like [Dinoponera quadriceps]|uniref:Cytochrome b5-related protein-like n=1 Tax=Dinoponera quadriceps TaxID=609295 RepID=A0A6P3Y470_DINQU|nr:PREDICTED: cytochrome b5-related protein-like [Dinoponera quadriceps]